MRALLEDVRRDERCVARSKPIRAHARTEQLLMQRKRRNTVPEINNLYIKFMYLNFVDFSLNIYNIIFSELNINK